eukprot:6199012-Pleurochrysis_carterae.AAC.1
MGLSRMTTCLQAESTWPHSGKQRLLLSKISIFHALHARHGVEKLPLAGSKRVLGASMHRGIGRPKRKKKQKVTKLHSATTSCVVQPVHKSSE